MRIVLCRLGGRREVAGKWKAGSEAEVLVVLVVVSSRLAIISQFNDLGSL